MERITELGLQKMDEQKIRLHVGKLNLDVGNQVKKGAKFVAWAQDWVGKATALSREASAVWSVVLLVLPLLTNPVSANEARENGYEEITSLLKYYVAQESMLLGTEKDGSNGVVADEGANKGIASELSAQRAELRGRIIKLYKAILDFQIQSVLRFYRKRFIGFANDALRLDDWESLVQTVKDQDASIKELSQQIYSARIIEPLLELRFQAIEIQKQWQSHLLGLVELARENLDVNRAILGTNTEQSETAKEQLATILRLENSFKEFHDMVAKKWADRPDEKTNFIRLLAKQVLPASGAQRTKDRIAPLHTIAQALCSVLHQLFTTYDISTHHALVEYTSLGDVIVLDTNTLWKILEAAASDLASGRIVVVFDALDQCKDPEIGRFIQEHRRPKSTLQLTVTTRPLEYITTHCIDAFENDVFYTNGENEQAMARIAQEVECIIDSRLAGLPKLRWIDTMKARLKERMLQVNNPTYLWIRLVFDSLEPKKGRSFLPTNRSIDKLLSELPQDFNEAYDRILSTTADPDLLRLAMSLIIASERPLSLQEIDAAMQITADSTSLQETKECLSDSDQFEDALKQYCGLFIVIQAGHVYLLHETGREFFTRPPAIQSAQSAGSFTWQGSISLQQAHTTIAHICMWALSLEDLVGEDGLSVFLDTDGSPSTKLLDRNSWSIVQPHTDYPFIMYACLNWGIHVRKAGILDHEMTSLYERLCDPAESMTVGWLRLYLTYHFIPFSPKNFDSLDVQVLLDHRSQVAAKIKADDTLLLPHTLSPVIEESNFSVPYLYLACFEGHDVLAEDLLNANADPNETFGPYSPLVCLIEDCKPAMLRLVPSFLAKGVKTTPSEFNGFPERTPLFMAAKRGLASIANMIMMHEKAQGSPSTASLAIFGETPLHVSWDLETTKILLEHGADPTASNEAGRLPWETYSKEPEVVKLLLTAAEEATM
ncbi:uncharacterized protein VDAG_00857 [Verticillium dahliae VdLs.17]|uniref:Uncharacterized protein n=1 Tax=Verticillium dahliae (strain VdLs.17 / ATCC MYA-4575 / FGSC 10137) TaxID=498257 RepID=G2WSS6_VERDV|nr:uncharacterized protein VDAG_00857 [Verticillium dahliae VdLs.17]EGY17175.1 hypothetical protein VDAG_00857 [Verticillium dahliae VdLs.17]